MIIETRHLNAHLFYAGTPQTLNKETSKALYTANGLGHKYVFKSDILQALSDVS